MENEFDEDVITLAGSDGDPGDIEWLDTSNTSMSTGTVVAAPKDTSPYDWEQEKRKNIQFYDDGTMTYLWRGHTLTVLGLLVGLLIYVSMFETVSDDTEFNAKRGMCACLFVFVLLGVTVTPDGPFVRPHPAFWRLMFVLSILYQLCIIFVLFQNARDARLLLKHIDPELGVELSEKSYGGNCLIYDRNSSDPFHNVIDKMDLFVPMHFFGWWFKTLVLRDWWLCTVISIMFEILEYTLEHQLPNFSECWWDHWILDALLCNGGGILLGLQTLKFFKVRTYYWRGLWSLPNYREKLKRIIAQFGPYSWIEFDWRPTSSLGRWMSVLGIAFLFLVAELNTFYLKFVLWVPAGHSLNIIRLMMMLFWGAVSLRETFQYLEDPVYKKFGRQSWVVLAIVCTEFLIVVKFDYNTITKPLPGPIALFWSFGIVILAIYTLWNFNLLPNMSTRSEDDLTLDKEVRKLALEKRSSMHATTQTTSFKSARKTKSDTSMIKKLN